MELFNYLQHLAESQANPKYKCIGIKFKGRLYETHIKRFTLEAQFQVQEGKQEEPGKTYRSKLGLETKST